MHPFTSWTTDFLLIQVNRDLEKEARLSADQIAQLIAANSNLRKEAAELHASAKKTENFIARIILYCLNISGLNRHS
jgi:hypothetical protein